MTWWEALLLVGGGTVAGTINTLAGGASAITVPLLVLLGVPGNIANGTNRVGVLVQCVWGSLRFHAAGVSGFRDALPILLPTSLGATLGAVAVSSLADETFERLFAVVMVLLLVPILGGARVAPGAVRPRREMAPVLRFVVFFLIGAFGGAFQAGVGLLLIFALAWAGYDLVRANSIKVVVNTALAAVALPVFILRGQVDWLPALFLSIGFVAGSTVGVHLAIEGGEKVIRPVIAGAVLLLAGRMLGLY
jgi:uncharacterized membrane protein YfcA